MKSAFFFVMNVVCLFGMAQQPISIIPQPVEMQVNTGSFTINAQTGINANGNAALNGAVVFLQAAIKNIGGFTLTSKPGKSNSIRFVITSLNNPNDEAYQLQVTPSLITIKANTAKGIVYGIQTLLQTLPAIQTNALLSVPAMDINDYPRFTWRGMHLDVSRHFFGPSVIKNYLDLMATYKMNVFHWHLVDDQGWRIEIKKYPALTQIGAWRVDQTDKIWGSRPQAKQGETPTYGGFYTQQQIKEIIQYASARNITIVPEIEMPGHVASAIAAYPLLSCSQLPQLPLTGGNYTNMSSNYCAGNEYVYTFLENVLKEVIDLFPSKYIHIGGDEVDKSAWKTCVKCQARMKASGLKDENELQSYFVKRIERFIIKNKRKLIGWDEILEGGLAPEAAVMSWRGESGGIEAAKMKHNVVMTPGSPCYFDHYQAGPEGEPLAFGGFNNLKKVYDYEPIPKELNPSEATFVLGAQGNVWTESITTAEHLEYMVLPRMLALAEVLWTPKENKSWDGFNERLQAHFKAFGQKGLHYCPGNFAVNIKPFAENNKLFVSLSSEVLHGKIYYTTDGSEPTTQSTEFKQPIAVQASVLLKASAVVNGKVMGLQAAKQQFVMHKAVGRPVTYSFPVSPYYLADGPNSLTDGVRGTHTLNKYWHGFTGNDLIATIDLGALMPIKTIALSCLQHYKDWIFLPKSVKYETSSDGIVFTTLQTSSNPIDINQAEALFEFKTTVTLPNPVRFIRVTAQNNNCPVGHSGAGKTGWIFADEIIVE
jgi:hexosaminidase